MNIKEIARRAGVSHQTVSNVLNNKGRMSRKTREKVLQIIKQMEYYPNEAARVLSKGRKDVIAFVSIRLASPFISEVLSSLEDRMYELENCIFGIEHYSTKKAEIDSSEFLKEILFSKKVRAVILLSILPQDDIVKKYKEKNVPLVLIENKVKGAHSIYVNNFKGAYEATNHLIKNGRKKIGIVVGRQIISKYEEIIPSMLERMEGYKKALTDNNLPFESKYVIEIPEYTYENGKQALNNLLERDSKIDAIFCPAGDIVAMGIIGRANEIRIKIPDDIAIVGYDDILAARHIKPALTTVRQPINNIGRAALDLTLDAINGKLKEDTVIEFEQELIIRDSSIVIG